MAKWDPPKGGESSRRRSQRVIVSVPVTVSSEGGKDAAFQEDTQTLVVNAHGAMVALAAKVVKGQTLRLMNRATQQDLTCKVVYIVPSAAGKMQVRMRFT